LKPKIEAQTKANNPSLQNLNLFPPPFTPTPNVGKSVKFVIKVFHFKEGWVLEEKEKVNLPRI
jgi:hypothetical protein